MRCFSDVFKKNIALRCFGNVLEKVKHLTNDASNDVSPPALGGGGHLHWADQTAVKRPRSQKPS